MTVRPGKWQHVTTPTGHSVRLTTDDGTVILTSVVTGDHRVCLMVMEAVRKTANTWSCHAPELVEEGFPAPGEVLAHTVEVGRHDSVATAGTDTPLEWVHHCTTCGYRGHVPPPLPCPGPRPQTQVLPVEAGRVDRGPGYEAGT